MIELLLAGERMLTLGLLDQAERLFSQVADADPKNAIAVTGLARVALERGDEAGALRIAQQALAIDPQDDAARRLADRLAEVIATRAASGAASSPAIASTTAPDARTAAAADDGGAADGATSTNTLRRSWLDRLRRLFRRR